MGLFVRYCVMKMRMDHLQTVVVVELVEQSVVDSVEQPGKRMDRLLLVQLVDVELVNRNDLLLVDVELQLLVDQMDQNLVVTRNLLRHLIQRNF